MHVEREMRITEKTALHNIANNNVVNIEYRVQIMQNKEIIGLKERKITLKKKQGKGRSRM